MPDRSRLRELAAESNEKGDPTGWFDRFYREAEEGKAQIPWADGIANPRLVDFLRRHPQDTAGKSALVVGCGLGDDSEFLAGESFATTAFDISPTAIVAAVRRFPHSRVTYVTADLFHPPAIWKQDFDFVFEANTLQALPKSIRATAMERIAEFVAPGGALLVIARGRDETEPEGQIPWPLTRAELNKFQRIGLAEKFFEEHSAREETTSVRRFCTFYTRPL